MRGGAGPTPRVVRLKLASCGVRRGSGGGLWLAVKLSARNWRSTGSGAERLGPSARGRVGKGCCALGDLPGC